MCHGRSKEELWTNILITCSGPTRYATKPLKLFQAAPTPQVITHHQPFPQDGKQRVWEAAARKTRKSTGVDAVAIVPILKHPSKPVSTMIIVQYRPPVEAFCVEFPAGLIDEGESPEQAAVRELREETGYSGKVCGFLPHH
jgi:hypothetical protein